MKIKICGLKTKENIEDILALKPDLTGFIFYKNSPRFFDLENLKDLKFSTTDKTGVFVNEKAETILEISHLYKLDYIQLHGNEDVEFCLKLKIYGLKIIKVFSVESDFDFRLTLPYMECCDYLLFDTKGDEHGGNGKKFNWAILKNYHGKLPFFLSGGIGQGDVDGILELRSFLPSLCGIDINSRFEFSPGIKNVGLCKKFMNDLKKKQLA